MPTVVADDGELVEANSKLGLLAGIAGFVVVLPAVLLKLIDVRITLVLRRAAVHRRHRPGDAVAPGGGRGHARPGRREKEELRSGGVVLAASGDGRRAGDRRLPDLPAGLPAAQPEGLRRLVRPRAAVQRHRDDGRERARSDPPPQPARGADAGAGLRPHHHRRPAGGLRRRPGERGAPRRRWWAWRPRSPAWPSTPSCSGTRPTPTGAGRSRSSRPGSRWRGSRRPSSRCVIPIPRTLGFLIVSVLAAFALGSYIVGWKRIRAGQPLPPTVTARMRAEVRRRRRAGTGWDDLPPPDPSARR